MSAEHAARALTARIDELALYKADVARAAGLSWQTVSRLCAGVDATYAPKTLRLVEQAVGWDRGTLRALLDDGEVTPCES